MHRAAIGEILRPCAVLSQENRSQVGDSSRNLGEHGKNAPKVLMIVRSHIDGGLDNTISVRHDSRQPILDAIPCTPYGVLCA